jgi:hypothetical protein
MNEAFERGYLLVGTELLLKMRVLTEWPRRARKGAPCFTLVERTILDVMKSYSRSGAFDHAIFLSQPSVA